MDSRAADGGEAISLYVKAVRVSAAQRERFQAIDLSSLRPLLQGAVIAFHGVDVSLQRASKTFHRVEAGLLGVFQPETPAPQIATAASVIGIHLNVREEAWFRVHAKA